MAIKGARHQGRKLGKELEAEGAKQGTGSAAGKASADEVDRAQNKEASANKAGCR